MKNIIKHELLNLFRETEMTSIFSVILASCFFVGFYYFFDMLKSNIITYKKLFLFAMSYSIILVIGPNILIQCFYKFKNNGNLITYLALRYSLYKIWLIKSVIFFILIYSTFISSLFISFLALIILKTFGFIEKFVFLHSFYDLYGLLIAGPILGISSYAFFGGIFSFIVKDVGEAIKLPALFILAITIGGIYILKNELIFSFVSKNTNIVTIIVPLVLSFVFIFLPKIVFNFFPPEKIILE